MKETDMSAPLQAYLEAQGFKVNCEVGHCDMTALKGDDLIIIELKLRMSLRFLYQVLQRKQITDSVYLCLPVQGSTAYPPEFRNLKSLLKRMEMGLILIRFLKTKTRVEMIQHPDQWESPKRKTRKHRIIREIDARSIEYNKAGELGKTPKITAYRKRVILLARMMSNGETWSPAALKKAGCHQDCGAMLRMNHYGWFVREDRGKYKLDCVGFEALDTYKSIEI